MKNYLRIALMFLFALAFGSAAHAQAPALFFTDLISGPATGNSDSTFSSGGGVYVTIYGNFFGTTLTSANVALNGANCLGIVSQPATWLWYQKFTVQLHSACTSGNFTVTTASGTSNGLSFTVQSGNIYYAAGTGNDSTGTGTFAAPWKTLTHARDTMAAGGTVYARTGSDALVDDGQGWSTTFLVSNNGTAATPYSFIIYPGQSVTIGSNSVANATRSGRTIPTNFWTFAGFHLVGGGSVNAEFGSGNWRFVGNDMTCPQGNGAGGCYVPIEPSPLYTYGNNIHNTGITGASAEYHAVYLATDANQQDFGWNEVSFCNGGRCIQTHSAPNGGGTQGFPQYSITIHDNIVHDAGLDCLVLDTVSPGGPPAGSVTIYNNVWYNCGLKTPPESTGGWNGLNIPGFTEAGTTSNGTIEIFNNTIYNYGTNPSPPYGGQQSCINWNGGGSVLFVHVRNNLCYSTTGTGFPYFVPSGSAQISGPNNWMFGGPASSGNTNVTGTVGTNPQLVNAAAANFVPQSGSPIIGSGTAITGVTPFGVNNISRDITGLTRPNPPTVGAFEFASASVPQAATPSCNPGSGTYSSSQLVTCTDSSAGSIMCYTTNGTTPATNGSTGCATGTLYSTALNIALTETLKVIAGGTGYTDSSVASYSYIIAPAVAPAPVIFSGLLSGQIIVN